MWIFCGGMQRSASTLQYQIASELVERNNLGVRISWHNPEEHAEFLSTKKNDYYKVFKSHLLTESIRQQFIGGKAIGLYIFRDLRDVVSSLQEKNQIIYKVQELPDLVKNLIKQHRLWSCLQPINISRYEDIIHDIRKEIISIARFIGILKNSEDINELSKKLSLSRQKKFIADLCTTKNLVKVNKSNIYDPDSLLHLNHISSGKIERYKDDLSLDQIKIIEKTAGHWLVDHGYNIAA